jgi:hypothetical protein
MEGPLKNAHFVLNVKNYDDERWMSKAQIAFVKGSGRN